MQEKAKIFLLVRGKKLEFSYPISSPLGITIHVYGEEKVRTLFDNYLDHHPYYYYPDTTKTKILSGFQAFLFGHLAAMLRSQGI